MIHMALRWPSQVDKLLWLLTMAHSMLLGIICQETKMIGHQKNCGQDLDYPGTCSKILDLGIIPIIY